MTKVNVEDKCNIIKQHVFVHVGPENITMQ